MFGVFSDPIAEQIKRVMCIIRDASPIQTENEIECGGVFKHDEMCFLAVAV